MLVCGEVLCWSTVCEQVGPAGPLRGHVWQGRNVAPVTQSQHPLHSLTHIVTTFTCTLTGVCVVRPEAAVSKLFSPLPLHTHRHSHTHSHIVTAFTCTLSGV